MKFRDYLTDDEIRDYDSLTDEDEKRLLIQGVIKRRFDFLVYILGYRDIGAFHKQQIYELQKVRKLDDSSIRRLWLWSRGFFKTSLITEAHSIFLIINNPDIRILLVSYTIGIAEDIIRNIKNHFMNNQEFRYFFPEFCPVANSVGKVEFGTNQDFTIPCRTIARKEPTMMCAGVGTNLTGLHFDYHKIDDLVTKYSVTNDSQIQSSKDYYASLRHLFDMAAVPREDVVGTIYHFNDLYNSVLRRGGLFKESFIPARLNGLAVFPERLPNDKIDELINDPSVGPYQVQTQYFLNPVNPEEAKFKEEWLKYYDCIPTGLAEYICVDPASKQKKKSDYTVIQRWGVDEKGFHYLLDAVRDKFTAFQRIDKLFEFVAKSKNLKWVKYEVLGGRHGDIEVIEERKRQIGRFFTVKETKASSQSKEDRIEQRLVGQYHAGRILLPQNLYYVSKYDGKVQDFIQLLKLEYLQFPFTEHDDILDCQAQMFEEQLIKGQRIVDVKRGPMTADDWDRLDREIDSYKKKFPSLSSSDVHKRIFINRVKNKIKRASYDARR